MSFPDFEQIHSLLAELDTAYPGQLYYDSSDFEQNPTLGRYLTYLAGHGFIEFNAGAFMDSAPAKIEYGSAKITSRGIDYIAANGGLTAQLSPVTIRFQPEDLTQLISARVAAADLPTDVKAQINTGLKSLPAESLKHLSTRLVDLALDQMPAGIQLLRTSLGL